MKARYWAYRGAISRNKKRTPSMSSETFSLFNLRPSVEKASIIKPKSNVLAA